MLFSHLHSTTLLVLLFSSLVVANDYADYCPDRDNTEINIDGTKFTIRCDGYLDEKGMKPLASDKSPEDCARLCADHPSCVAALRVPNGQCWSFEGATEPVDEFEEAVLLIRGEKDEIPEPDPIPEEPTREELEEALQTCEGEKEDLISQAVEFEKDRKACDQKIKDVEKDRDAYKKKYDDEVKKHAPPPEPKPKPKPQPKPDPNAIDPADGQCNKNNHGKEIVVNGKRYRIYFGQVPDRLRLHSNASGTKTIQELIVECQNRAHKLSNTAIGKRYPSSYVCYGVTRHQNRRAKVIATWNRDEGLSQVSNLVGVAGSCFAKAL
ncbi:hypothetical protein RU639_013822 [Aspergillus parasiticus]